MLSALGEPIVDSELVSVAAADLVDFVLRVHVMNWEARVVEFAHRIGVHQGVREGVLRDAVQRLVCEHGRRGGHTHSAHSSSACARTVFTASS
jgi:hypothetical protein